LVCKRSSSVLLHNRVIVDNNNVLSLFEKVEKKWMLYHQEVINVWVDRYTYPDLNIMHIYVYQNIT
jgi:hypothetical protein